jgi:tripartite-type tricarboxylate transporter receptor subunit TctC
MLRAFFALILAGLASGAAAQGYPSKPVHLIVPFATGGPDTVARLVGAELAARWGQPFLVENRPAANGMVGHEAVARSAPDGYTLMVTSSGFVVAPSVYKKLPYDTERDFTPVTNIARNLGIIVAVNPSVPARTLQEFIAYAKNPENKVSYSSPGIGNTLHLIGELFNARAGVKMLHVPYKGGGPAVAAVVSGEVQAMMAPMQLALANIKAGKLRGLAYSLPQRSPQLPDVPTAAEAGLAGFELDGGWFGMLAPANTPPEIVDRLQKEIRDIVTQGAMHDRLLQLGFGPVADSPAEFRRFVSEDIRKYREMARLAGVEPE